MRYHHRAKLNDIERKPARPQPRSDHSQQRRSKKYTPSRAHGPTVSSPPARTSTGTTQPNRSNSSHATYRTHRTHGSPSQRPVLSRAKWFQVLSYSDSESILSFPNRLPTLQCSSKATLVPTKMTTTKTFKRTGRKREESRVGFRRDPSGRRPTTCYRLERMHKLVVYCRRGLRSCNPHHACPSGSHICAGLR